LKKESGSTTLDCRVHRGNYLHWGAIFFNFGVNPGQGEVAFPLLSTYRLLSDTYYLAILRAHLKAIKKAKLVVNARATLVIFVVYRNLSISGPSALFS
jgi:hypothetical protein